MTEQELKKKLAEWLRDKPAKIWLTRSSGHRLDFLWSVGEPQEAPSETLAREGIYYIVGQGISEDLRPRVLALFQAFCQSEDARQGAREVKPLRFIRTGR